MTDLRRLWRSEALRAAVYTLILLWINGYICRDMFTGSSTHMGSMHGFWAALAARAGGSWFHAGWWPYWDMGIPFESTYPPLVPGLSAAAAALRGVPAGMGFRTVTGIFYILGPCSLFFMAWRLTRAPGRAFAAALAYSLTSVTQVLAPDAELSLRNFWDARRLYVVSVWDDTPHVAALAFLPLAILFLARSIETRRPVYYDAAAFSIGCAALSSAFGPVMMAMAAGCLLCSLQPENWRRNLLLTAGIGAWGWALAAPFLSPSLMSAIRQASWSGDGDSGPLSSLAGLAFTAFGWLVLWQLLPRWTSDWRLRFFALFAWVAASIPLGQSAIPGHFLPQPDRYKLEMELALCLVGAFALKPWADRMTPPMRRAFALLLVLLTAAQVTNFRKLEKRYTFPTDVTRTVEYRAATWAQQNYPEIRFFMAGSIAQWTNTFSAVQQFTGESFTMATNPVQQRADDAIAFGGDDLPLARRISLDWLKAYGVGAIAIGGKESQEFWKAITHPEKFRDLPALWTTGGVTIYRIPLREFTLAHQVPEGAIVRRVPAAPDDIAGVERYVAALDDPSLPGTAFAWEGRNRIRIRTTAAPGRVVTVQESYHPGWHATVAGSPLAVYKDGLGLMWLRPAGDGPCEIVLDYDGGWELRLCRWLSWLAIAALAIVPAGSAWQARRKPVGPPG